MLTAMSQHYKHIVCPFWWCDEHIHDMVWSSPVSLPFLGELQPTLGGEHATTLTQWKGGGIRVSDPDPHLVPNMLNEVDVWTTSWPVHDLRILLCMKSSSVMCCSGRDTFMDIHKMSSKNTCRPGKSDVAYVAEGFIQHHQFTPFTILDATPCHYWGATVTVSGLNARIYQFLSLPVTQTSTTIAAKQPEGRLITEDTVPPVTEVPPSVRSPHKL